MEQKKPHKWFFHGILVLQAGRSGPMTCKKINDDFVF